MSEPILEMKNISKNFGSGQQQVHAVQDVSLSIRTGEIFGIIYHIFYCSWHAESHQWKNDFQKAELGTSEYDRCATKWNRNGCAGERNHFGGNRCRKYFSGRDGTIQKQVGTD